MRSAKAAESALAGTLAAGLYACTLAPGVGAGDGGELLLAASTFGVPHPPGYPLWATAASAVAAIPLGSLALRVNALSLIFAAIAAALLWSLARRSGVGRFGAAAATALYATSIAVWRSAVEAEVYSLAAAAFLSLVHLAWNARSRAGAGRRADALFFLFVGLAYLAHQTLAAPALVLAAWVLARWFTWGRVARAAGWIVLGLTPALVVPLRVLAGSGYAWKSRAPLEALADVFSRGAYGAVAQNPPRLELFVDAIAGMSRVVASSLGPVALALGLVAGIVLVRRRARRAGAGAAGRAWSGLRVPVLAALSVPVGLAAVVRFTPDAEHLAQVEPFLIPVVAMGALVAGSGAAEVLRASRRAVRPGTSQGLLVPLAAAACSLAVVGSIAFHYPQCDRAGFHLPERYGRDLLASVPRGATLVVDGDNETFLAAHWIRQHGARPDLTVRHRRGCVFGDAYGLAGVPRSHWIERARDVDLAAIEAGGEVWFATPPADLERAGVGFSTRGLASRARPAAARAITAWRPPASWPRSSALLAGHPERFDFVTRKLAIAYSDAAARAFWDRGDATAALAWYEDAARVGFDMPEAHWNVAVTAAAAGAPERALDALLAARALAPHRAESAARLAAFLAAAGRYDDAARWFERAFQDEPSPALAADASRAWILAGEPARAARWSGRRDQAGRSS